MDPAIAGLVEHFSYLALLALLVVAGLGVPIPEEPVLLSAGLLASRGALGIWRALAVCWVGILLGDSLIFRIGRRLGVRALQRPFFRRLFTPRIVAWLERHFTRWGALTVVVARHVAGLRAATFLAAGMSPLPYWKFLLADAASALVSVPVTIWLGYHFGAQLPRLVAHRRAAELIAAAAVLGIALLVALVASWRRRARERSSEAAAAEFVHFGETVLRKRAADAGD